jgi:hypothetical protein
LVATFARPIATRAARRARPPRVIRTRVLWGAVIRTANASPPIRPPFVAKTANATGPLCLPTFQTPLAECADQRVSHARLTNQNARVHAAQSTNVTPRDVAHRRDVAALSRKSRRMRPANSHFTKWRFRACRFGADLATGFIYSTGVTYAEYSPGRGCPNCIGPAGAGVQRQRRSHTDRQSARHLRRGRECGGSE